LLEDIKESLKPSNSRQATRLNHLMIANLLSTGNLSRAREAAATLSGADSLNFSQLIFKVGSTPVKKPVIAALMSTIVPGSGKLYTGQVWDSVTTFIICAFSGWRAWEGFSETGLKSFDGWLFSAITAYFYLGNIYGSAVAAQNFNKRRQHDLRKELESIINAEN